MTGASLVGCDTWRLYQTDDAEAPMIMPAHKPNKTRRARTRVRKQISRCMHRQKASSLHLERAAADLVSKPTTRLSMGTKIPPPPTPPTVPNAEPRNPTTVATTTRQLNARSWEREREKHDPDPRCEHSVRHEDAERAHEARARQEAAKERTAYGPDAR